MVSDRAQYVILAEDEQAQTFAYRALLATGAKSRRIRRVALPSRTGGGGHGFVLARYPDEVVAVRRQGARAQTGLVVHIDADDHTVAQRHQQLAARLQAAGQPARGNDEPICELVPRRNIETWIYALDDELMAKLAAPLDELTAYPKLEYESGCADAARAFAEHAKHGTTPPAAAQVPSLRDGLAEFQRLP